MDTKTAMIFRVSRASAPDSHDPPCFGAWAFTPRDGEPPQWVISLASLSDFIKWVVDLNEKVTVSEDGFTLLICNTSLQKIL